MLPCWFLFAKPTNHPHNRQCASQLMVKLRQGLRLSRNGWLGKRGHLRNTLHRRCPARARPYVVALVRRRRCAKRGWVINDDGPLCGP
jgi:hypothetical protein